MAPAPPFDTCSLRHFTADRRRLARLFSVEDGCLQRTLHKIKLANQMRNVSNLVKSD